MLEEEIKSIALKEGALRVVRKIEMAVSETLG
jgi:hypothetical protein